MKISVYITSYNQKALLAEAIDSVLAQTLRPHEIIVVDDASSDGSQATISGYAARHPGLIRPIFHERNTGVARTRIDALSAVSGDAVTYVDGDDRILPAKIEREARALAESGAPIAFSNHYYMDGAGNRTGIWAGKLEPPQGSVLAETFARDYPGRDLFRMELIRVADLKSVGFHDPSLATFEDFDLRIRLTRSLRTCYVNEPLAEIRRQDTGLSWSRPETHFAMLMRIYRKNRPLLRHLDPGVRRRAERRFLNWLGSNARKAGQAALIDARRSAVGRRAAAARFFLFCVRHAPDELTLGDILRLVLPARAAVARIEGTS
jgi:glycosyltransferase involved in cell wall biosynthesis